MPTRNVEKLEVLERREQKDKAKLEWLHAAATEGFSQLDRGEGIEFESMDALGAYLDRIGEEVSTEVAAQSCPRRTPGYS